MADFTPEQLAQIAALIGAAQSSPAVAAPAAPVVASPFTASAAAAADGRPESVQAAIRAYAGDQKSQRRSIAVLMLPQYSCDVDTTATLADGTVVPSALHGFTTAHKTGEPCNGAYGIERGKACPGKVR